MNQNLVLNQKVCAGKMFFVLCIMYCTFFFWHVWYGRVLVHILVLQHLLLMRLFVREKRASDEPSESDGCVAMNLLQRFQ